MESSDVAGAEDAEDVPEEVGKALGKAVGETGGEADGLGGAGVAAAGPADGAAGCFSDSYRDSALPGCRGPTPPDITAASGTLLAPGMNINGFSR